MKKTKNTNSGFTLIELIIAIAVLAFLMTAVTSFMGTGVLSFKKAKADVSVHNSAQDVYDQLATATMSANDVVILAYVVDGTVNVNNSATFVQKTDALEPAFVDDQHILESGVVLKGPYYFVKSKDMEDELKTGFLKDFAETSEGFVTYDKIPAGAKLYVKQIIVDHAVPIDPTCCSTTIELGNSYTNANTNESVEINYQTKEILNTETDALEKIFVTDSKGNPVYNVNDTERLIITFDSGKMYVERKYGFMDELNDYSSSRGIATLKPYLYSESFNYYNIGTEDAPDTIPGCVFTVNDDYTAVGIELFFSDKNMTYHTNGLISFRNSYVIKEKK